MVARNNETWFGHSVGTKEAARQQRIVSGAEQEESLCGQIGCWVCVVIQGTVKRCHVLWFVCEHVTTWGPAALLEETALRPAQKVWYATMLIRDKASTSESVVHFFASLTATILDAVLQARRPEDPEPSKQILAVFTPRV
jgi:hypothetical protein